MTSQHRRSQHHHRDGRGSGRLPRLLGAVLALVAVSAGPPAVLLTVIGNPTQLPAALRTVEVLRRPLDDQTLLWLLAAGVWLLWAHLLGTLIVEALRQTRGSTLRMPLPGLLFGANTALASQLIATLLLTTHPGSTSLLTPAGLRASTVSTANTVSTASTVRPQPTVDVPSFAAASTVPTPPVAPAAPVAADPHRHVASSHPETAAVECRVLPPHGRQHDTLWDIAERHLGDGTRWREVYRLNEGRLMPDGRQLTHASLIYPGWILRLPADALALDADRVVPASSAPPYLRSPAATPGHRLPAGSAPVRHIAPGQPQTGAPTPAAAPIAPLPVATGPQPAGHPPDRVAAPPAPPAVPPSGSAVAHHQADQPAVPAAALPAALSVAALGLLAALTRRRKVAARRRPPGSRAATPPPELRALEARIRRDARAAGDIAATVRLALLLAGQAATDSSVKAVWHHPDDSLELVLTHPPRQPASRAARPDPADGQAGGSPPVAGPHLAGVGAAAGSAPFPFTATGRGWLLPADNRKYLFATSRAGSTLDDQLHAQLQRAVDPFPLLLPVGARDGSSCLVNLETFGLISLLPAANDRPDDSASGHRDGDDLADTPATVAAAGVLGAFAQALASAPWSELMQIVVSTDLAAACAGLNRVDVLSPTLLAAVERTVTSGEPLTADQPSLEVARRTDPDGAGIITTFTVLGATATQLPSRLLLAATRPTEPFVAVLHGHHPDAHPWQLQPDGTLSIPGVADHLRPLRLDADQQHQVLRLLEHAQDPPLAAADDSGRLRREADTPPTPPPATTAAGAGPAPDETTALAHSDVLPADDEQPADDELPSDDHRAVRADVPVDELSSEYELVADDDLPAGTDSPEQGRPLDLTRHDTPRDVPAGQLTAGDLPAAPRSATPHPGQPGSPSLSEAEPPSQPEGADPQGPVHIGVLGPLQVHGAARPPRNHLRQLLVYLAVHRRPIQPEQLWESVWPDKEFDTHILRARMSDAKKYLNGHVSRDGRAWLLQPDVSCDWQQFKALAAGDTDAQLAALALVRGRPFEDVDADWMHLEGQHAEIEATVVDLALQVGQRSLDAGEHLTASAAAAAGLRASPYEERLYQLAMRAAAARGAHSEVRALRRQLEHVLDDELEPDDTLQPGTSELYRTLLDAEPHPQR